MKGMGRLTPRRAGTITVGLLGAVATAALGLGSARAAVNEPPGPTAATTTTTRARPPRAYTPSVAPDTIDNRSGCGRSTTATVSTGTTGDARRVTFRVQVGGRITTLYASGSGSRWSATLKGSAFGPDHGSGSVRATATGPGGTTESGPAGFTVNDCPA